MNKLPSNFEEAILLLDKILSDREKSEWKNSDEDELLAKNHFEFGLTLRNEWIFNKDCKLNNCFGTSIHDDEKSAMIIRMYRKYLRAENFDDLIEKCIEDRYPYRPRLAKRNEDVKADKAKN